MKCFFVCMITAFTMNNLNHAKDPGSGDKIQPSMAGPSDSDQCAFEHEVDSLVACKKFGGMFQ